MNLPEHFIMFRKPADEAVQALKSYPFSSKVTFEPVTDQTAEDLVITFHTEKDLTDEEITDLSNLPNNIDCQFND